MKRIYLLILMMILPVGQAWGATIYVKSDASGTANGTSWTDAYTTVQAALNAAATGDDIHVYAGTYTELLTFGGTQAGKTLTVTGGYGGSATTITNASTTSTDIILNFTSAYTSGTVTFNSLTISGIARLIKVGGVANLTFNDCVLTNSNYYVLNSTATGGGAFTFHDCDISLNASATNHAFVLTAGQSLTISGGTNTSGTHSWIYTGAAVTAVTLSDVDIDCTAIVDPYLLINVISSGSIATLSVTDCDIRTGAAGGVFYYCNSTSVTIGRNVITNNTTSAYIGIGIGTDGNITSNTITGLNIYDNEIYYLGSGVSHGILVGRGVLSGNVYNNHIYGANNGLIIKSDGVLYGYNRIFNSTLSGIYLRCGQNNTVYNNTISGTSYSVQFDTQDAGSYENTDTTAPTSETRLASAATFTSIGEGGSITLNANSPSVDHRARIVIKNPTAGSLNLYEGTTAFAVSGTHNGSAASENITFTSTSGNKAVAAGKYRYKTGSVVFDEITSVTVTHIPAGTMTVSVSVGGVKPAGNIFKNNIMYAGSTYVPLYDFTGAADGNMDENEFDSNDYYQATGGNIAMLNYGGTPPTTLASLTALKAGWVTYSTLHPDNDATSISADPKIGSDGSLQSDSPCINKGELIAGIHTLETPATNYAGTSITTLPDIGAYEYPIQDIYFSASASAGGNGTREYPYHLFADYPSWSGYAARAGANIYVSGTFAVGLDLGSLTEAPTYAGCKKNKTCTFPLTTGTLAVPVHGFKGQSMMSIPRH